MSQYKVGSSVQYYSASHGLWIDTLVEEVQVTGEVQISCKKGYLMPVAEQAQKLRSTTGTPALTVQAVVSPSARTPPHPVGDALIRVPTTPTAGGGDGGGGPQFFGPSQQQPFWAVDQSFGLGQRGVEELATGWAKMIDPSRVSSVHAAVEQLNNGSLTVVENFCIIHSSSSQNHFLLYKRGYKDAALVRLMEHLREVMAAKAALKDELARAKVVASSDIEGVNTELATCEAALASEREQRAEIEQACNNVTAERNGLEERLLQLSQSREDIKDVVMRAAAEVRAKDAVQEALEAAQSEAAQMKEAMNEEAEKRRELQSACDRLEANLAEAEADLGNSSGGLEKWLAAAETELSLQTALSDEQEERVKLEQAHREEIVAREALEERLKQAEGEIARLSGVEERVDHLEKNLATDTKAELS